MNPSGTICVRRRMQCEAQLKSICVCICTLVDCDCCCVFFLCFFYCIKKIIFTIVPYIIVTITNASLLSIFARELREQQYDVYVLVKCRYHFCLNYLHAMRWNRDFAVYFGYTVNRKQRQLRVKRTRRDPKMVNINQKSATVTHKLTAKIDKSIDICVFRNVIMLLLYFAFCVLLAFSSPFLYCKQTI